MLGPEFWQCLRGQCEAGHLIHHTNHSGFFCILIKVKQPLGDFYSKQVKLRRGVYDVCQVCDVNGSCKESGQLRSYVVEGLNTYPRALPPLLHFFCIALLPLLNTPGVEATLGFGTPPGQSLDFLSRVLLHLVFFLKTSKLLFYCPHRRSIQYEPVDPNPWGSRESQWIHAGQTAFADVIVPSWSEIENKQGTIKSPGPRVVYVNVVGPGPKTYLYGRCFHLIILIPGPARVGVH